MAHTASFVFRALVALLLMGGFYLLAFGMSAALLFIPYATLVYAHHLSIKLTIGCAIAALAILKGCVFVRHLPFEVPGPLVTEHDQPEIFRLIREIAARMSTRMPDRVYLIPDVNAFVTELGGFLGFGSRRVMGIGVGLLHIDNVSQLKATLAHEFGHYAGGDTRIGAVVYRTRTAIVRVVENLSRSWISKPFALYANLFMRVSRSVSRDQELAADRAAILVAGRDAHTSGLQAESRGAVLFGSFIRGEVAPLVDLGFCASNLFEGFAKYRTEVHRQGVSEKLDEALKSEQTSRYDTHPALPERLAYAQSIVAADIPLDARPAVALLEDAERIEQDISSLVLGRMSRGKSLQPIAWGEAAVKAYAPMLIDTARKLGERIGESFGGSSAPDVALRTLGNQLEREGPLPVAMVLEPDLAHAPPAAKEAVATSIVADAMGLLMGSLLVRRGGTWQSELGKTHQVAEGDTLHEPFLFARQFVARPKELLDWLEKS